MGSGSYPERAAGALHRAQPRRETLLRLRCARRTGQRPITSSQLVGVVSPSDTSVHPRLAGPSSNRRDGELKRDGSIRDWIFGGVVERRALGRLHPGKRLEGAPRAALTQVITL